MIRFFESIYWGLKRFWFALGFSLTRAPSSRELLDLIGILRPSGFRGEWVRVGSASDGGYWLPDRPENFDALFSPGVGSEVSFEMEFANRGIDCYLADGTVVGPPLTSGRFEFTGKNLGIHEDFQTISLASWVSDSRHANSLNLILQMDIEGSEYEVLLSSAPTLLDQFRVIVLELHRLDWAFSRSGFVMVSTLVKQLSSTHEIVALNANNSSPLIKCRGVIFPTTLEVVLVRRDSIEQATTPLITPRQVTNVNDRPAIELPEYWKFIEEKGGA